MKKEDVGKIGTFWLFTTIIGLIVMGGAGVMASIVLTLIYAYTKRGSS